jgi:hypothetical protein
MIAATWGTGQVLLDILWFFLIVVEVYLMFTIFVDLFRRHDIKGWLKAFWVLLIIVLPLLGILLYLIVYGDEMRVHAIQERKQDDQELQDYVRRMSGVSNPASELKTLHELKERGIITEDEFERVKSRIVNG